MKAAELSSMSETQLVDRFMSIALEQYAAELQDDIAKYNRLFNLMSAVKDELKSRAGDQRHALVSLFGHPNPQVRLKAAQYSLAVVPAAAREVLQGISDNNEYPQAADARLSLRRLDAGTSLLLD